MSVIDLLRGKDLVDLIDNLEPMTDGTYRKRCELHNGGNPTSFTVFPSTNTFRCWSCDASGDIFGYIMERDGVTFAESVEILADHYNISLKSDQKYTTQKSLAEKNEYLCKTYEQKLPVVHEYLTGKRGFTEETIKQFRFGWAEKMKAMTIPLIDRYGRVVSFSYRFFNSEPKYKHGRNNDLFDKSTYWYNLINARKQIKKKGRVYLVEGHLDAASCWQQNEPALAY